MVCFGGLTGGRIVCFADSPAGTISVCFFEQDYAIGCGCIVQLTENIMVGKIISDIEGSMQSAAQGKTGGHNYGIQF